MNEYFLRFTVAAFFPHFGNNKVRWCHHVISHTQQKHCWMQKLFKILMLIISTSKLLNEFQLLKKRRLRWSTACSFFEHHTSKSFLKIRQDIIIQSPISWERRFTATRALTTENGLCIYRSLSCRANSQHR